MRPVAQAADGARHLRRAADEWGGKQEWGGLAQPALRRRPMPSQTQRKTQQDSHQNSQPVSPARPAEADWTELRTQFARAGRWSPDPQHAGQRASRGERALAAAAVGKRCAEMRPRWRKPEAVREPAHQQPPWLQAAGRPMRTPAPHDPVRGHDHRDARWNWIWAARRSPSNALVERARRLRRSSWSASFSLAHPIRAACRE